MRSGAGTLLAEVVRDCAVATNLSAFVLLRASLHQIVELAVGDALTLDEGS